MTEEKKNNSKQPVSRADQTELLRQFTGRKYLRGVASIFQRGEESHCVTPRGTYQIVMSTSTLCFTKSDIFSDEQ